MIGDRYLTDVVYGNRHGLLTIRPAPLTLEGEPSAVLLVRNATALLMPATCTLNGCDNTVMTVPRYSKLQVVYIVGTLPSIAAVKLTLQLHMHGMYLI